MLARSCVAGELTRAGVAERMYLALGRRWRWVQPLARRFEAQFRDKTRPSFRQAREFLRIDERFGEAYRRNRPKIQIHRWIPEPQVMQPVPAAAIWAVPAIESVDALCSLLGVAVGELEWFADLRGIAARSAEARLQHYWYRIVTKKSGGFRLIEAPKLHLKQVQQMVLRRILDKIPVHPAVHGFVPRRSVCSFATPHVGKACVLKMDLENFFPSIRAARVQAFFRTAGYPDTVASLLAGLCTNVAPRRLWQDAGIGPMDDRMAARDVYCWPHLPQGAPTSPALANICAYGMDCRLSGLAEAVGAEYSRYADDLVFSGDWDFGSRARELSAYVGAIAVEEGFAVNFRKTRVMQRSSRQQVAGVVVNERLSLRRKEVDRLKAVLTNCVRFGPESQNRKRHLRFAAHLKGKVDWVAMVHPSRGHRLQKIYDQIDWTKG